MGVNGQQQEARFSFEAFRFVQHKNRTLSTFYLHCSTRLCERSVCTSLQQVSHCSCADVVATFQPICKVVVMHQLTNNWMPRNCSRALDCMVRCGYWHFKHLSKHCEIWGTMSRAVHRPFGGQVLKQKKEHTKHFFSRNHGHRLIEQLWLWLFYYIK